MLTKSRGIVLNFIKYKESSIITKIYTEEFGIISCIVNGVRSSKAKGNKIAFYQPLTILDLVIYYKPNQELHRISEAKISYPYQSLSFNIAKSSITIFLTEILGKILKEEEKNEDLFLFMLESFQTFDQMQESYTNFHLQFLIQLADFLGFGISSVKDFSDTLVLSPNSDQSLDFFARLLHSNYSQSITANGQLRYEILTWLIHFYQLHFEHFGQIKSLEILRELQY